MSSGDQHLSESRLADLEKDADLERDQLRTSASELRAKVALTRNKLQPEALVRDHFFATTAIAAVVGLTFGYVFARILARR